MLALWSSLQSPQILILIALAAFQIPICLMLWKTQEGSKNLRLSVFLLPIFPYAFPFLQKFFRRFFAEWKARRNEKFLIAELPPLTESLRTCLKAGLLPAEAVAFVRTQRKWKSNISTVLATIDNAYAGGMSLSEALQAGMNCVDSKGMERFLHLLLLSLQSGYGTGGDLIGLLERLHQKISEAVTLRRKALVYTAQMRLQAQILTIAPAVLAGILSLIHRQSIAYFLETQSGNLLILVMLTLNILGAYFLKKAAHVDGL